VVAMFAIEDVAEHSKILDQVALYCSRGFKTTLFRNPGLAD